MEIRDSKFEIRDSISESTQRWPGNLYHSDIKSLKKYTVHSLIYELPGFFFSSLMVICIYLSTEKNNSTSKNAAWVFCFCFFLIMIFGKPKKKDFKNKFRQTS